MSVVFLLDVDGVLADFIGANLRTLAELGINRQHDDVTDFRLETCLNLSDSERAFMKARWSEPGFCASFEPYPGAREGVGLLRSLGEVYAVTAPMWSSPTWQHERCEWLCDRMGFERDQVVSTAAKHLVCGDVFVDDREDVVTRWHRAHRDRWAAGVVWARPYNDVPVVDVRTNDWRRVAALVVTTKAGR